MQTLRKARDWLLLGIGVALMVCSSSCKPAPPERAPPEQQQVTDTVATEQSVAADPTSLDPPPDSPPDADGRTKKRAVAKIVHQPYGSAAWRYYFVADDYTVCDVTMAWYALQDLPADLSCIWEPEK